MKSFWKEKNFFCFYSFFSLSSSDSSFSIKHFQNFENPKQKIKLQIEMIGGIIPKK